MRRFLFWVLLLITLVAVVALGAHYDQGYVLIVYPPWRVEMSFVLALALVVGMFLLGYVLMRFVQIALRLPRDVRAWRDGRRKEKTDLLLARMTAALISGQPGHARKLADQLLDKQAHPLAALIAAKAAQEVNDGVSVKRFLAETGEEKGEFAAARQAIERAMQPGTAIAVPETEKPSLQG